MNDNNEIVNKNKMLIDTYIQGLQQDFSRHFEAKIKEALKLKGYEFETDAEFYQFAKDRCTRVTRPDDWNTLIVDAHIRGEHTEIASWHDRYEFDQKDGRFKASLIRDYK